MDQDQRRQLREEVEEKRGYWHPFHEGLLDMAPSYLAAYLAFHDAPFSAGRLDARICEFIYIAADAAVSHLFEPGIEVHVERAIELGATPAEVLEVIQLTTLAAHSTHAIGLPILAEEMERLGGVPDYVSRPLTADEEAAKSSYVAATGHWPDGADLLFKLSPGFARAFLDYGELPYRDGPLPLKVKEFVCIAVYSSPVAPQPGPLRQHIQRALEVGASPLEVADVLQLTSAIAIHTCIAAIPPLMTAARNHEASSERVGLA